MDTTETTTPAQQTAARLRALADFLEDEAIDLPAPDINVAWHLHWTQEWRPVVHKITDALDAKWVGHHSGSSHWLRTVQDTRVGPLTIFVPEEEPRPVPNPDLSEFTVAGRARAEQA